MLAIGLHVRGVGTKAEIEGGKTQQGIGYWTSSWKKVLRVKAQP